MGEPALTKWMQKNEAVFNKALKEHEDRKALRKQKRAKKRSQLKKPNRPLVVDHSDEDVPPTQRKQPGQAKPKISPPTLEQPDDGLFVKQPPITRRAPLDQSTDDEEDNTESAEELNNATSPKNTRRIRVHDKPDLGNSILCPKYSHDKATQREPDRQGQDEPRKPSRTLTTPVLSTNSKSTGPQQKNRRGSESTVQGSTSVSTRRASATTRRSSATTITAPSPTNLASSTTSTVSHRPPGSVAPVSKKNGTAYKGTNPIRMTNGPKESSKKQWNSDGLYNKLKYRGIAEKRSRAEGTPDLNALEFVGTGPPNMAKPRTANPADNPYGRREAGTRRMQEIDTDETPQRESRDEISPLHEWEANKVPLVCPHWRLSRNCPHGMQKCRFLHRDQDENGRNLPVGQIDGIVPAKYRRPPITCLYWLQNENGCNRQASDCDWAHYNTGWIPTSTHDSTPFKIDSAALPVSEQKANHLLTTRNTSQPKKLKPEELTCWYWAKGICKKLDTVCKFQHYDTGTLAKPPCSKFAEGRCPFTANECEFLHSEKLIKFMQADANYNGASLVLAEDCPRLMSC
jgi:chromo domain-containing protein 1